MNWNARKGAFLVAIGQTVVLVEHERAVRACINIQRDRVGWFLAGVLQFRAERNDGTGADEQRHRIVGRRGVNGLSARSNRTGPEVVPINNMTTLAPSRMAGSGKRAGERGFLKTNALPLPSPLLHTGWRRGSSLLQSGRQINIAAARLVGDDGRDEERRAEHVFIGDFTDLRVAWEIHDQWPHQ